MGHALLTEPKKTIPVFKKLSRHNNAWMVRCVGVATHYAVKKGLQKTYSERMFQILLSLADSKEFHIKKGIGWAAKTVSKFHPDIIHIYKKDINENPEVKQWFKTKIKIGLGRSFKYATKYPG
jgi:3-methyladenine DNA glycosylase AlkD